MWGKYGKTAISAVKSLIKQKNLAIKTKHCFAIKNKILCPNYSRKKKKRKHLRFFVIKCFIQWGTMCLDLRPQADRYNRLKDLNYAKVDIRWN